MWIIEDNVDNRGDLKIRWSVKPRNYYNNFDFVLHGRPLILDFITKQTISIHGES